MDTRCVTLILERMFHKRAKEREELDNEDSFREILKIVSEMGKEEKANYLNRLKEIVDMQAPASMLLEKAV